ncbi:MAG: hypothetical protein PF517_07215 [Salinivirgaceae bacterium]|jgi:hypothetical protein|nr:hypothetical protein [Salinivirgaceae bacterium]
MNKGSLVKIIKKELAILADFVEGFNDSEAIHSMEVDLALSKVKDIQNELLLLKDNEEELQRHLENEKSIKSTEVVNLDSISSIIPETEPEVANLPVDSIEIVEPKKVEQVEPVIAEEKPSNIEKKEPVKNSISEELLEVSEKVAGEIIEEEAEEPIFIAKENQESEVEHIELVKEEVPEKIIEEAVIETFPEQAELGSKLTDDKPKEGILADKFSKDSLSINDMLAGVKRNKDLASLLKDSPIVDLKKAIKLNDRIWYIDELFGKNSCTFEKAVNEVNESENLDAALEYLFTNYKWDQERKSTISFLELVFRRFATK